MPAHWQWPVIVELVSIFCFAVATMTRVSLSLYYRYTRSADPDVARARICPYQVNDRTIFLTKGEMNFLTGGLLRFALLFWFAGLVTALAFSSH